MRNHALTPKFRDYEPGPDFDRARSQIATDFRYLDIPLDTALSNQVYNISGAFLYVDASSTGQATLEFNNQYNDASAPFLVQASWAMEAIFSQVKITAAAQAGKKLRLIYSSGARVIPNLTGQQTVSIVNANGAFSQSAPTVTNASANLLAANANRRFLMIQNNHATGNVFVRLDGATATTANGFKVPAAGGVLVIDNFAPTGAIVAIGDVASNTAVIVTEG